MKNSSSFRTWEGWIGISLFVALAIASISIKLHLQAGFPEIALTIGEPFEKMRQRSSASIDSVIPHTIAFGVPNSDARFRFIDPQYGFLTPPARFFTISYDENGLIFSVRMSPQIEPLLLDDALKVVLDIQDQLRKGSWIPVLLEKDNPSFADTPKWREKLRHSMNGETCYWQAGDKYQILLDMGRFKDNKHPTEERYLITLNIGSPWLG